MPIVIIAGIVFGVLLLAFIVITSLSLRRVVPTNEVHIIQSRKTTTSYGKDTTNGNVYWEVPSWVPIFGITKVVLPVSVFQISLQSYDAYDIGRVPFVVDIVSFFRIEDSNMAAKSVSSFKDLEQQLLSVVRGAVRTILASHDIDNIMVERSKFGEAFTVQVTDQLKQWGVTPVKNIELMDIRDAQGDQVVHNIMQKKKSLIEMQSRTEVANNMKTAQIAEIAAKRDTELQAQQANQAIGERDAQRKQEVGIATEKANQAIKEQEKATQEKQMAVLKVQQVGQATITKEVTITQAEQQKETAILVADGALEAKKRESEGIQIQGDAKAAAEKAMLLAPVHAQITLAQEIGTNEGYQKYLVTNTQIEANKVVGVEQAKALEKANIKVIANTGGDVVGGIANVRDLFSAKGGTNIGAMLEGLSQTEAGEKVMGALGLVKK